MVKIQKLTQKKDPRNIQTYVNKDTLSSRDTPVNTFLTIQDTKNVYETQTLQPSKIGSSHSTIKHADVRTSRTIHSRSNGQNEIRTQFGNGRMFQNPFDTDNIYQEPHVL